MIGERGAHELLRTTYGVSRETCDRLGHFVALLGRWNKAINLVGPRSLDAVWTRHILDSAQLLPHSGSWVRWADLGSGGGLPGLVIAILAAELVPGGHVVLVESDQRKAVFLQAAVRELRLGAEVIADRAERIPALGADVVSARAMAPLRHLLGYAAPHLAPDGRCLFPKGQGYATELAEARAQWAFEATEIASRTDPQAVILQIERIRRA